MKGKVTHFTGRMTRNINVSVTESMHKKKVIFGVLLNVVVKKENI